jgi:hypothetical protein
MTTSADKAHDIDYSAAAGEGERVEHPSLLSSIVLNVDLDALFAELVARHSESLLPFIVQELGSPHVVASVFSRSPRGQGRVRVMHDGRLFAELRVQFERAPKAPSQGDPDASK